MFRFAQHDSAISEMSPRCQRREQVHWEARCKKNRAGIFPRRDSHVILSGAKNLSLYLKLANS